jgi:hypothetical protein
MRNKFLVNILFVLCGGRSRTRLYNTTKQLHKATIEIEKGGSLFTYVANSIRECKFFNLKIISAPSKVESLIIKKYSSYDIHFLASGRNISDSLRNFWTSLREQYFINFEKYNLPIYITLLCGDAIFIKPKTIDHFGSEASKKRADVVFQTIEIENFRKNGSKKPYFIYFKDSNKKMALTHLFQFNLTKKQEISLIEEFLFKKKFIDISENYYNSLNNKENLRILNFLIFAYKLTIRRTNWLTATSLLVEFIYRFLNKEIEEEYIRKISSLILGFDLDYVLTTNSFDTFDIDHPEDLQFARRILLSHKTGNRN